MSRALRGVTPLSHFLFHMAIVVASAANDGTLSRHFLQQTEKNNNAIIECALTE